MKANEQTPAEIEQRISELETNATVLEVEAAAHRRHAIDLRRELAARVTPAARARMALALDVETAAGVRHAAALEAVRADLEEMAAVAEAEEMDEAELAEEGLARAAAERIEDREVTVDVLKATGCRTLREVVDTGALDVLSPELRRVLELRLDIQGEGDFVPNSCTRVAEEMGETELEVRRLVALAIVALRDCEEPTEAMRLIRATPGATSLLDVIARGDELAEQATILRQRLASRTIA